MKTGQTILLSVAASVAVVIAGCNEAPSNSQSGGEPAPAVASQSVAEQAPPAASVPPAPVALLKAMDAKVVEGAKTVAGQCSVDQVSGSQVTDSASIKKGAYVTVIGWSSNEKLNAPAQVTLVLEGAQMYGATLPTGQPRPDVAKALGNEGLANSGFSASLDISAAAPGDYKLMVLVQESDGSQLCDTTRHWTISN